MKNAPGLQDTVTQCITAQELTHISIKENKKIMKRPSQRAHAKAVAFGM